MTITKFQILSLYSIKTHHQIRLYELEATDHIVLEDVTADDNYVGNKIVQESGDDDITDIRMIASGGGYTSLPTPTITVGDRFIGLEAQTNRTRLAKIQLEHETILKYWFLRVSKR